MKAVTFSNNDTTVVAWTFGCKLNGCLGFAIYRIDVLAGTETRRLWGHGALGSQPFF
jgi:hypothetical protein